MFVFRSLDPSIATSTPQYLKDDGIVIISLELGAAPGANVNINQLQNILYEGAVV